MKKFLVPIDGSEQSNVAVEQACELAKLCGAEIVLLHIDESRATNNIVTPTQAGAGTLNPGIIGSNAGGANTGIPVTLPDNSGPESSEFSHKILNSAKTRCSILGEKVSVISMSGDPANAIIDFVKNGSDIDLVVMGSNSKTGLKKFFVGSVANKVATSIDRSVLIVR